MLLPPRNQLLSMLLVYALVVAGLPVQAAKKDAPASAAIKTEDLRDYLGYISSDDLDGRETFTEGLGLAAGYIAAHLQAWGVKPGGDHGGYFEKVLLKGVKVTNHSTLTVEVNGQSKTFKEGEGITFPRNPGGKRKFSLDQVEFIGYGLYSPANKINDYAGKDLKGRAAVFLGAQGPKDFPAAARRTLRSRASTAVEEQGAAATIGVGFAGFGGGRGGAAQPATPTVTVNGQTYVPAPGSTPTPPAPPTGQGGGFGRAPLETPDFSTVTRLDSPTPPQITAQDSFFEFLFSESGVKYAELKDKAAKQDNLPSFTLKGVKLTFNIDADYRVVSTQFTRNVVGIVEGGDPKLKDTFVTFGAHYDHLGYAQGEIIPAANGAPARRAGAVGRVTEGALEDRIWNGADDDGSGTVTLLAIAKAFAIGPRPKRSVAFFWHAGEEEGLYGSRFNADYPLLSVPLEKTVANLNMDMIGRNDQDKPENSEQLFLVGSDRISTELHEIVIDVNSKQAKPLKLDFKMNDPADPERVYYRSDHYSYAAKGIPIVFFTTGSHKDYHANTDSVEKIEFDKMARIGQLVYATGMRVANMDHAPARDNKGPRAGADARMSAGN